MFSLPQCFSQWKALTLQGGPPGIQLLRMVAVAVCIGGIDRAQQHAG